MIIIEFCQKNRASWTKKVYEEITQSLDWSDFDLEVMEYDCLGNCSQCSVQPFVMVEGEIVAANSPEDLLKEIREFLKKKEELDRQWKELGF